MDAMPWTMVQKMTGAIIILMRFTKASPSHLHDMAVSGALQPSNIPSAIAIRTWT